MTIDPSELYSYNRRQFIHVQINMVFIFQNEQGQFMLWGRD